MTDATPLSHHHLTTVEKILQHPVSHNIEWREVVDLLGALGTGEERHDGKFVVTIGDETEIVDRPRNKDIGEQLVVDLRRMLTNAGYGAAVKPGSED